MYIYIYIYIPRFYAIHVNEVSASMPRASKSRKSFEYHVSCSPHCASSTRDDVEPLPASLEPPIHHIQPSKL